MENEEMKMSEEMMNKAVEAQGQKIYKMFFDIINPQITDAVTQLSPNLAKDLSKACALEHIKPFKNPLENLPKEKLDGLNGAALERFEMVVKFWEGVSIYLHNL
jgi:hypothetical protein